MVSPLSVRQAAHLRQERGQDARHELLTACGRQVGHLRGVARVVREVVRRQLLGAERRQALVDDGLLALGDAQVGEVHGRLAAFRLGELQGGGGAGRPSGPSFCCQPSAWGRTWGRSTAAPLLPIPRAGAMGPGYGYL